MRVYQHPNTNSSYASYNNARYKITTYSVLIINMVIAQGRGVFISSLSPLSEINTKFACVTKLKFHVISYIMSCRQRPGPMRSRFTRMACWISARIRSHVLAATRSHTSYSVEPASSSLVALPYGTMAAVGSTSVISVLTFMLWTFGALWWSVNKSCGHRLESSLTSQLLALSGLQNTVHGTSNTW